MCDGPQQTAWDGVLADGGRTAVGEVKHLGSKIVRLMEENAELQVQVVELKGQVAAFLEKVATLSKLRSAGFFESTWNTKHAWIQLLTIEEILNGNGVTLPHYVSNRTLKQAQRRTNITRGRKSRRSPQGGELFGEGA